MEKVSRFDKQQGVDMAEIREIVLYGEPMGKGRPRYSGKHGFVQTYTPGKTVAYENRVKAAWVEKYGSFSFAAKVPLCAVVIAYVEPAHSLSAKKRKALLGKPVTKKPDSDNIAKIILDGLQGVAYPDDAAVYCQASTKLYDEVPRVEVAIWEVEP